MRGFWKRNCGAVASLVLFALVVAAPAAAGVRATPEEAKAMLERAATALQKDEAAALAAFNAGTDGFKEKDLYVFCGNVGDGMSSAHGSEPWRAGTASLREQVDVNGKKYGEEFYAVAKEGEFNVVEYAWPRPGQENPIPKASYITKVGDQICGVGYYK
jgi:signal transduction histidine kinase